MKHIGLALGLLALGISLMVREDSPNAVVWAVAVAFFLCVGILFLLAG